jgi:N-glycosylase/DNA lyase
MSTLGDRIFHRRKAVFLKFNVGRWPLDVGRLFVRRMEISAPDFDLEKTLDSGQVFHWEKVGKGFVGTIGDLPVCIEQRGEFLCAKVASASSRSSGKDAQDAHATISSYFALDHPLAEICASFPDDPVMNSARLFCRGLRIIRQPKWECLATFICSSMKQVAHIRQISIALRRRFGERRQIGNRFAYTFPLARRIARASENDLRECALGYRARNLLMTARLVSSGKAGLEAWSALPDADLREKLCALPGVGMKVANCVMLFAYERLRAFPIDVWIERVLKKQYFPRKKRITELRLREFSETYFGEHGGYAQQYLFHHARIASRRSRMTRDSSTPKAFGACNDKETSARTGKSKRRAGAGVGLGKRTDRSVKLSAPLG